MSEACDYFTAEPVFLVALCIKYLLSLHVGCVQQYPSAFAVR